jgi:hypothetical protein
MSRSVTFFCACLLVSCGLQAAALGVPVEVRVDATADVHPISPYVYGSNLQGGDKEANVTCVRMGGNRTTGYNWESNYSNAGSDYRQSSDDFMVRDVPEDQRRVPGIAVTNFQRAAMQLGAASIVTLQMAGYVAADNAGTVTPEQTAPSPRWVRVQFRKGAPFSLQPDLHDGVVYMDEQVNSLVSTFGRADKGGVTMYSLDNEPALWAHTHLRIHPKPLTCDELIERSVALSAAVKDVDPTALIIGPALFGYSAYENLSDKPEVTGWDRYSKQYDNWFINFYLDRMRQAGEKQGRRLLDVLDLHWYPEARGDGQRIVFNRGTSSPGLANARVQAPRSLWDPTYREDSWIGQYRGVIRLLPRLQEDIQRWYPGTKLSFTEFDYGGARDASGAVAHADVLGLFGRYGVFMANHWGSLSGYTLAAYQVYRNYDGQDSTFGDTSVSAQVDDAERASAYASLDGQGRLHLVLINRSLKDPAEFDVQIAHAEPLARAAAYVVDSTGPQVRPGPASEVQGNRFTYAAPPLSVSHLVLSPAEQGGESHVGG